MRRQQIIAGIVRANMASTNLNQAQLSLRESVSGHGMVFSKGEKRCYLELGGCVTVPVDALSDAMVFVGQSLQKIIVDIKSYPQTEQGDVILDVLLHVLLNFG